MAPRPAAFKSALTAATDQLPAPVEAAHNLAMAASQRLQTMFPAWDVRAEALVGSPASAILNKADLKIERAGASPGKARFVTRSENLCINKGTGWRELRLECPFGDRSLLEPRASCGSLQELRPLAGGTQSDTNPIPDNPRIYRYRIPSADGCRQPKGYLLNWEIDHEHLSDFWITFIYWKTVNGAVGTVGVNDDVPDAVLTKVERHWPEICLGPNT